MSESVQAISARAFDRAKPILFLIGLYPLLRWVFLAYQNDLTANPVEFLTRSSGTWTLVCLLVTLSISPLRQWLKQPALLRWRRMCGLFTFFYAFLHALTWAGWDQSFALIPMLNDVWKRPFILVGAAAFLTMSVLAVTSTHGWMRRLGRRWQQLHSTIYLIGILAILHYWWHKQGKSDFDTVLIYAAVLFVLLAWRVPRAIKRLKA
ncbi:protein-methionine-sulfoxide reductase heme-binding subunit MsrQ [Zwartia sp.]|uniref:sulfite oxidase heme-binding subunit YedZ n=1 Tax=Zwartia sp. TaxID=2978004 RepID=UPI0028B1FA27|nr:protein-methionine-sulfoxide reductase heme-binding subunit MsrQ [Zwartia sp.]